MSVSENYWNQRTSFDYCRRLMSHWLICLHYTTIYNNNTLCTAFSTDFVVFLLYPRTTIFGSPKVLSSKTYQLCSSHDFCVEWQENKSLLQSNVAFFVVYQHLMASVLLHIQNFPQCFNYVKLDTRNVLLLNSCYTEFKTLYRMISWTLTFNFHHVSDFEHIMSK